MRTRAAVLLAATTTFLGLGAVWAETTAAADAATHAAHRAAVDPVEAAVNALTTEPAAESIAAVPGDFGVLMGYTPTIEQAMVVNPSGDCSSPIPLPVEFDIPCMAHDLGYDLLRYAGATGATVSDDARRALDNQLDTRMHDACDARAQFASRSACLVAADVAASAVSANSWRQGYGEPIREPFLPFAFGAALVLGAATLVPVLRPRITLAAPRTIADGVIA